MSNIDLESVRAWVDILQMCKRQEAKTKILREQAEEAIKTALGGPGHVGILDGEPIVEWTTFKTNRLDQKALKAEHPEIVASFTMPGESNRFVVK